MLRTGTSSSTLRIAGRRARKLTLNYGLRGNFVPPIYEKNDLFTNFDPAAYDPAKKLSLYQPTLVNGQKWRAIPLRAPLRPAVIDRSDRARRR